MRCPLLLMPVIITMAIGGLLIAPQLPDPAPVHWSASGTPDGYGSPLLSILLPPALALLTVAGMWWLPRIDRRRSVGARLTGGECAIMAALVLFAAALQVILIGGTLGWPFGMPQALMLALGALLIAIGAALPHIPRNTFVGVRTPWTLGDAVVWRRTHQIAGWLFAGAGALLLGLAWLAPGAAGFIGGIVGALGAALAATIVSAVIARREAQGHDLR